MSRRRGPAPGPFAAVLAVATTLALAGTALAGTAAAPVARNGTWTGTTSQHQSITLTVRSHIVTVATGSVVLTPMTGTDAAACPVRKFAAKVTIPVDGPQKSARTGFTFALSADATVSGAFTSARAMTGKIDVVGDAASDPCTGVATFTAKSP